MSNKKTIKKVLKRNIEKNRSVYFCLLFFLEDVATGGSSSASSDFVATSRTSGSASNAGANAIVEIRGSAKSEGLEHNEGKV